MYSVRLLSSIGVVINWELIVLKSSVSEWHEISAAAEASATVYGYLGPSDARVLVPAAWNGTTKTMTLETRSLDRHNTLIIAVRGSVTMMDWAVNANSEPAEAPEVRCR